MSDQPTPIDNLAAAVCHQLDDKGCTQHWLAQQVDTTDKHLSQMLNGRAEGSVAMWDKLFDALKEA
ncbi:helix-turn-helix domain-containing protein [Gordonia sp. 852002-10350_SCH5691597]|uniref:helix-turn-helix domain-containing protein n=1 Tax=Gordonia sp. 852002-10350_SCH5691597 TaxID=1834085 RepID=UPI0007EBDE19|nr:helix-turn-helix domain-containing protein [Gordonia sp. 852002-10350_SCH5691597]OBA56903.1 hypothetical protein A5777_07830 [Gordonia sp. 852002-10350_SCH5691597]